MKRPPRHEDSTPALRASLPAVLLAACGGLIQGFDTGGISNGRTLDDIQTIWRDRAATLFSHHAIRK
ncbi:MAG: hypothetical protein WC003_04630 [Terrimicrobiaceae bacterium]